jgi:hypothetical protein
MTCKRCKVTMKELKGHIFHHECPGYKSNRINWLASAGKSVWESGS